MTTRRLRFLCWNFMVWGTATSVMAVPVGPPTPPPCAADGTCIPARTTWGYYGTQWRLWPGTEIDPSAPADEADVGSDVIGPVEKPNPEREDRQAPPTVEALEPVDERGGAAEDDFELPPGEEFENGRQEAFPRSEEPPQRDPLVPPRPGFMDRPPGAFPTEEEPEAEQPAQPQPTLPFGQPPAGPNTTPQPPTDLFPSNRRGHDSQPRPYGDDAPPRLPFAVGPHQAAPTHAVSKRSFVQPASANVSGTEQRRVTPIPVETSTGGRRAQTLGHGGDAPPELPAFLRSR